MDEKLQVLDIEEQEAIGSALVLAIKECPDIIRAKKNIMFESIDSGKIGLFPQQGSIYLKKFISGSFIAQYNFFLRHRTRPSTDKQKLEAEELLNKVASWLENEIEYPELTDGRTIESISRTSHAFAADMAEDGEMDHQIYLSLKYRRIKK